MPTINNLNTLGQLKISGTDANKFLQGQITCDVNHINENQASLCAYCTHKGRIFALFIISKIGDDYLLIMPKNIVSSVHDRLKKFVLFAKVKITNVSDEYFSVAIQGKEEAKIILQYLAPSLANLPYKTINIDNGIILIMPNDTIFYFGNNEKIISKFKACYNLDTCPWQVNFLLSGIPVIETEQQNQFLCHPLNLISLGAINFKKGCYVGQEIIARTEYKGKVKKHAYLGYCQTHNKILPLQNLYIDGQEKGQIINSYQYKDKTILLILIPDEAANNLISLDKAGKEQILLQDFAT